MALVHEKRWVFFAGMPAQGRVCGVPSAEHTLQLRLAEASICCNGTWYGRCSKRILRRSHTRWWMA